MTKTVFLGDWSFHHYIMSYIIYIMSFYVSGNFSSLNSTLLNINIATLLIYACLISISPFFYIPSSYVVIFKVSFFLIFTRGHVVIDFREEGGGEGERKKH